MRFGQLIKESSPRGFDLAVLFIGGAFLFLLGAWFGIMIEHQSHCPHLKSRVTSIRTISTAALPLQAGGIWELERKVAVTREMVR